jgi:hypothetical protein
MNKEIEELLPPVCYGLNEVTNEVIIIKRGETGYYKTDWGSNYTKEMVDKLNEKLEVTKEQAQAMKVGSMFGWDVKGANPKMYEGKLK